VSATFHPSGSTPLPVIERSGSRPSTCVYVVPYASVASEPSPVVKEIESQSPTMPELPPEKETAASEDKTLETRTRKNATISAIK
jgi:hypothetical protein